MCIAQKTLKSMPSTSIDMNQDNEDLDDIIYTPKSGPASPIPTPLIHDRPVLITASSEENHHPPPDSPTSTTALLNSSEPSS